MKNQLNPAIQPSLALNYLAEVMVFTPLLLLGLAKLYTWFSCGILGGSAHYNQHYYAQLCSDYPRFIIEGPLSIGFIAACGILSVWVYLITKTKEHTKSWLFLTSFLQSLFTAALIFRLAFTW